MENELLTMYNDDEPAFGIDTSHLIARILASIVDNNNEIVMIPQVV